VVASRIWVPGPGKYHRLKIARTLVVSQAMEDGTADAVAGATISIGIRQRRLAGPARGPLETAAQGGQHLVAVGSHELVVARVDRLRTLRGLPRHEHRDAERRALLLDPAGVGQDDGRPRQEIYEREMRERSDQAHVGQT